MTAPSYSGPSPKVSTDLRTHNLNCECIRPHSGNTCSDHGDCILCSW